MTSERDEPGWLEPMTIPDQPRRPTRMNHGTTITTANSVTDQPPEGVDLEALRAIDPRDTPHIAGEALQEAADEIERLRALRQSNERPEPSVGPADEPTLSIKVFVADGALDVQFDFRRDPANWINVRNAMRAAGDKIALDLSMQAGCPARPKKLPVDVVAAALPLIASLEDFERDCERDDERTDLWTEVEVNRHHLEILRTAVHAEPSVGWRE